MIMEHLLYIAMKSGRLSLEMNKTGGVSLKANMPGVSFTLAEASMVDTAEEPVVRTAVEDPEPTPPPPPTPQHSAKIIAFPGVA